MEILLPGPDPVGVTTTACHWQRPHHLMSYVASWLFNEHLPAYSTGLTVILLLVLVKQVANVTVILPELHMALLACLLCLKQWYFTFILSFFFFKNSVCDAATASSRAVTGELQLFFLVTCCTVWHSEHCTSLTLNRSIWWFSSASWHSRHTYSLPQQGACSAHKHVCMGNGQMSNTSGRRLCLNLKFGSTWSYVC